MFDINFILIVTVQVICIFIFLSVFYFTYAKKKEADVVYSQVDFLIDSFNSDKFQLLPDNVKKAILAKVNNVTIDVKANQAIDQSNNAIYQKIKKIVIGCVVLLLLLLGGSYILHKKGDFNYFKNLKMGTIIVETIVIVLFVALTEFVFLTYLASKYISLNTHVVKAQACADLAQAFSTPAAPVTT